MLQVTSENKIIDFIYYDTRRVSSFLAQFEEIGHLTNITSNKSASKKKSSHVSGDGSVSLPLNAKGKAGGGSGDEVSKTEDRGNTYDPLWANAISYMTTLRERNLVKTPINDASIGQFIETRGILQVADIEIVHKILEIQQIKKLISKGMKPKGSREERRRNGNTDIDEAELLFNLLKSLPHHIVATLKNDSEKSWCVLDKEHMVIPSHDIFLKHGRKIQVHGILSEY